MFDRSVILSLGANCDDKITTLSGVSIAIILSALGLLENRSTWDEMSDTEWGEIVAILSQLAKEVM